MTPWAQAMCDEVTGGSPLEIGKSYIHPVDEEILVISGQYWTFGGLSNFWYWTVKSTGETHHGYGARWPEVVAELTVSANHK